MRVYVGLSGTEVRLSSRSSSNCCPAERVLTLLLALQMKSRVVEEVASGKVASFYFPVRSSEQIDKDEADRKTTGAVPLGLQWRLMWARFGCCSATKRPPSCEVCFQLPPLLDWPTLSEPLSGTVLAHSSWHSTKPPLLRSGRRPVRDPPRGHSGRAEAAADAQRGPFLRGRRDRCVGLALSVCPPIELKALI